MADIAVERWLGNVEKDNARRVLVLPGMNYPISMPGLLLPMRALAEEGWTIWAVTWDLSEVADDLEALQRSIDAACDRADAASAGPDQTLVVGKSVGTLAAAWAAQRRHPAIWLTPLLRRDPVRDAIAANPSPQLLLGGTDDPAWDGQAAEATGAEVCSLPHVDHGLFSTQGWRESLDALGTVCQATTQFAARLRA